MIEINKVRYSDYNIKITWGEFNTSCNGKKRYGIAPYITFHTNDIIKIIGLEFTFSKAMFLDTKINKKTNINDYVSISFYNEKEKECDMPLIEKGNCFITRINEEIFNFDFYIQNKGIEITINEDIKLFQQGM